MQGRTITRYSTPTQVLHWLTAMLVLLAFIYSPGGSEERVYSAARDFERQLHETLGLCVRVPTTPTVQPYRSLGQLPTSPHSKRIG